MAGPWEAYKKNRDSGSKEYTSPAAAQNAQPGAWAAYKNSEQYKSDVKNYKKTYKSADKRIKAQQERAAKLFQARDARRMEEEQEQQDVLNEKRTALRNAQKQVTEMTKAGLPLVQQRQKTMGQMSGNGLYARYRAAMAELEGTVPEQEAERVVHGFGEALQTPTAGALGKYIQGTERRKEERGNLGALEKFMGDMRTESRKRQTEQDVPTADSGSDAAMEKWQNHWAEDLFQGYLAGSGKTTKQSVQEQKEQIAAGTDAGEQLVQRLKNRGEVLASLPVTEENTEAAKNLLREAELTASPLFEFQRGKGYSEETYEPARQALLAGDMEEYRKQTEIYNRLFAMAHPNQTAAYQSMKEASGLDTAEKWGTKLFGTQEQLESIQRKEQPRKWAQQQAPGVTLATKTVVNLGLMAEVGGVVGAAAAPLAKGATTLGNAALSAGKTALTFAAKDAIQSAGGLATGEMTGGEFAKQVLGSAAGGMAGSIASGLTTSGLAKVLTDKKLMTPFMEYLRQMAGSMAFSTGNLAGSMAVTGRKMDAEELATELATSFAFAMINGYMQAMQSTKAASQAAADKFDQISQEFEAIQNHMNSGGYATQEEYEQALKDVRAHVQQLRAEVGSTYYAGQQEFVNGMTDNLDLIVNNIDRVLGGGASAPSTAGMGASGMSAADVRLLTEEVSSALQEGVQTPVSPQGTPGNSTAINDDPARHTAAEQRVIEAYKSSADKGLAEFYQRAKTDQNAGRYTLQAVTQRAADDIRNLTGQEVDGFKTTLDARQAWHINNDHGANGKADHSMENDEDVARMQYVLNNYDSAEYGGTTDAYWESKKNGRSRRSPVVVFSKKVNGTYYVVEATPVTKAKSVYVVSAYMLEQGKTPPGRNGQNKKGANPQPPDANAPWLTSENDSAEITPGNSVAQNIETVNRDAGLPGNMEVADDSGIPDWLEVTERKPEAATAAQDGANATQADTDTPNTQNADSEAQEAREPEERTLLRKATSEDARKLLQGESASAGKYGKQLQEYRVRLREYDDRQRERAQTTDADRVRELDAQIAQDEEYLAGREKDLKSVADIVRARLQSAARQKEADIEEMNPDELRTLQKRTQQEEAKTERAAQAAAIKADEGMLERFAEHKGYSDLLTSYVIAGYEGYRTQTGRGVEQYAAAVQKAYEQGAQGLRLRQTEQMTGIQPEVLQQAYAAGKEQNGAESEDAGGKRDAGMDSSQPAGRMDEGTGSTAEKRELDIRERVKIENRLRAAGQQAVSTRELGIQGGSEDKSVWELPETVVREYPALQQAKKTLTDAGAERVRFVTGTLRVKTPAGKSVTVQAVTQGTTVWIKAADVQYGLQETAAHEALHLRLAENPGEKGKLITALRGKITAAELDQLARRYAEAYAGCYGEEDMAAYLEEILCDAYAGINRAGTHAEKYQDAVRRAAAELPVQRENKAPEATRGPPEQKMSLGETKDGRPIAVVDSDILSHMDTENWDDQKKRQAQETAKNALLAFKDGIRVKNTEYRVNKASRDEFTRSRDTEHLYKQQKGIFADKMRAASIADDIIVATTDWARDGKLKHPRTDNLVDFTHGQVLIESGGKMYEAETVIGITKTGKYVFYDVVDMAPLSNNTKEDLSTAAVGKNTASAIQERSSEDSIRASGQKSQGKFSAASDADDVRKKQFQIIQNSNPADDAYHTWIRSADEILTLAEAINDPEWSEYDAYDPDYTREMAEDALKSGKITVYSSYKIGAGAFVTPSKMEAESYSGSGRVYSKTVPVADVAWIDPTQGQYAPIRENARFSAKTEEDAGKAYSYDTLPAKARQFLSTTISRQAGRMAATLDIPGRQKRELLKPALQQMTEEFLQTGKIEQKTIDKAFDDAYNAGVVEDREFYDTYKPIKDKLRKTGVAITPEIRADIADFNQFRKGAMGRILMKNDGIPVDTLYAELHDEAPGLFPAGITNPTDQLEKMLAVSRMVEITKKSLDESYGAEAAEFKRWAKNDFEAGVSELTAQLRLARRYAEAAARTEQVRYVPKTVEEAQKLGEDLRKARKSWEKVQRKVLLTKQDEGVLNRLLRGELDPEQVKDTENAANILKAYEAKADYAVLQAQMVQWRKSVRAAVHQSVDPLLEHTELARDKTQTLGGIAPGLRYAREVMERNIEDVFPAEDAAKINRALFEPVHTEEAKSTKFKNTMRKRVKEMNLSRKAEKGNLVSEAHAVQLLGEAEDAIRILKDRPFEEKRDGKTLEEWQAVVGELWKSSPNLDKAKIESAVKAFRAIYDELLLRMNEVRVRNGYEPIAYRKGYFPHFQPGQSDGILSLVGKAMGVKAEVTALPTSITGLTHSFKPGITWFGNAQERLGFNTAYDAVEGFDKYIEGAANVIFQTDNIQRLRAFNQQLRYRTTDDGVRERVDNIRADDRLTMEEKEEKIRALYEHAKFELGGLAQELDEYTNQLAGKKSRYDREMESVFGRGAYNVMKALESRVAANMVAVNPGSWLTNFIPITQAWGYVSTDSIVRAVGATIKAQFHDDGFWENSAFLTNRRGSDPLVRAWSEALSAKLGKPMDWIDTFTADTVVRARFLENQKRGMDAEDAMREADRFAANIMADRSRGATPTLFNSRNPVTKLFTQFQLEVNNQFSNLFKDMPREMRTRGLHVLALALFKTFIGAWVYNEIYEKIVGRRAALDPIDLANDLTGDLSGYKLNNIFDVVTGSEDSLVKKGKPIGLGKALANFAANAAEELPLVGGLLGGGRVPFSSALPDLGQIVSYATNEEMSGSVKAEKIFGELRDPLLYMAFPFGGGQVRKMAQGIYAVAEGGKFVKNSKGELQMQFPVYTDDGVFTALRTVQALTFGRNSTKEARDWVDEEFSKLSVKETNAYLAMTAADVRQAESWKFIKAIKDVEVPEGESSKQKKLEAISAYNISDEAKMLYYYNVLAGDTEKEKLDEILATGIDTDGYLDYLAKANLLTGDKDENGKTISGSLKQKQYDLLDSYDFTEEQKTAIAETGDYKTTGFEPWTEQAQKLHDAVMQGNPRKYLQGLREQGYELEDLRAAVKQVFREEYIAADKAGRKKMFQKICNAYTILGKSQKEAENTVNGWVVKK